MRIERLRFVFIAAAALSEAGCSSSRPAKFHPSDVDRARERLPRDSARSRRTPEATAPRRRRDLSRRTFDLAAGPGFERVVAPRLLCLRRARRVVYRGHRRPRSDVARRCTDFRNQVRIQDAGVPRSFRPQRVRSRVRNPKLGRSAGRLPGPRMTVRENSILHAFAKRRRLARGTIEAPQRAILEIDPLLRPASR